MNDNKGITILALAVTIIVILILAGVTINMTIGENGIITASKRIEANTIAAEKEAQQKIDQLKVEEGYDSNGGTNVTSDTKEPTINSIEAKIQGTSIIVNVNITETGAGLATVEYSKDGGVTYEEDVRDNRAKSYEFKDVDRWGSYTIMVKATDKVGNETIESTTINGIKVGDYINYVPDTATPYTTLTSANTGSASNPASVTQDTLNWQVLRTNDDGSLDLVGSPTRQKIYFQDALGYNNGVYLMNDICEKLYSKSSQGITARSINVEDFEHWLTDAGKNAINTSVSYAGVQYGKTKTYTGIYAKYYPTLYAQENGSGINTTVVKTDGIGVSAKTSSKLNIPTTQTYTTNSGSLTVTETLYVIAINKTNFGDAENVLHVQDDCWVASRAIACGTESNNDMKKNSPHFALRYAGKDIGGYGMRSGDVIAYASYYLRPVVSLGTTTKIKVCTGTNSTTNMHQITAY